MKQNAAPKRTCSFLIFILFFLFAAAPVNAQTLPQGFFIRNIGTGWNEPVGSAFNKSGTQLFVWEKGGKVFVCNYIAATNSYRKQAKPVLDISHEVGNWRDHGLLGFALDPHFDRNGYIYLLYVVDRHYLMNYGTSNYHANTDEYYAIKEIRVKKEDLNIFKFEVNDHP